MRACAACKPSVNVWPRSGDPLPSVDPEKETTRGTRIAQQGAQRARSSAQGEGTQEARGRSRDAREARRPQARRAARRPSAHGVARAVTPERSRRGTRALLAFGSVAVLVLAGAALALVLVRRAAAATSRARGQVCCRRRPRSVSPATTTRRPASRARSRPRHRGPGRSAPRATRSCVATLARHGHPRAAAERIARAVVASPGLTRAGARQLAAPAAAAGRLDRLRRPLRDARPGRARRTAAARGRNRATASSSA